MTTPLSIEMEALLTAAFSPTRLVITNDSARHHGHAGDDGSGESQFTISARVFRRAIDLHAAS